MTSSKRSGKILTNEYKLWLGKNPLTTWMRRTRTTQMQVAAKIGVSTYAVYLWQHGTSIPNPARFERLQKLTGNDNIIKDWVEWKELFELQPDKRV